MSVLEEVLEEEYRRSLRLCRLMETELAGLPRGSLRTRTIGSREYYYLNHREGSTVKSDYVPAARVEEAGCMSRPQQSGGFSPGP